jgi:hypothetical protein
MSVEEFKMKLFNLINWVLVLVKNLTSKEKGSTLLIMFLKRNEEP